MIALLVFVLAGLGTYAARSAFILALGQRTLPDPIERALRFVGPAVLAALATSLLTSPEGLGAYLRNVPEVVATVVAVVLAWKTRRFIVSFVGAVVALFALQLLL